MLREYACSKCHLTFESWDEDANVGKCPTCKELGKRIISAPHIQTFKPFVHQTLAREGDIRIETKKQFAEECEKRGFWSPAIGSDAHMRRAREVAEKNEAKERSK